MLSERLSVARLLPNPVRNRPIECKYLTQTHAVALSLGRCVYVIISQGMATSLCQSQKVDGSQMAQVDQPCTSFSFVFRQRHTVDQVSVTAAFRIKLAQHNRESLRQ